MKHAAYSQYKPSGVEWLDVIPSHWMVKSAQFGYSIQLGKMLQPEPSSTLDAETPYLKSQHVQWELVRVDDLPLMWASPSELIKYGIQDGDLLVCEGGDVGRAGIIQNTPQGTIIQNALHRVRPRKQHDIRFLMYVLEHASGQSWFDIICNRSTIAHFTGEKFGALRVPAPPLEEQQTITRFLDAKTAQIDALVAQKRQLIAKLKEKRQALIARTVTRGLPPEAAKAAGLEPNPEMKDSEIIWIGEIPAHWTCAKTAFFFSAGMGQTILKEDLTDEGVPVYSATEGDHFFGRLIDPKLRLKRGDIVVPARGNSIGHVKLVAEESTSTQTTIYFKNRVPSQIDSEFAFFFMKCLRHHLFEFDQTAIPQITVDQVLGNPMLVPPMNEQLAICKFLRVKEEEANCMLQTVELATDRLTEYRQALITSAVTGKIDVRELA